MTNGVSDLDYIEKLKDFLDRELSSKYLTREQLDALYLDKKDHEILLLHIKALTKHNEVMLAKLELVEDKVNKQNDFISRWKGAAIILMAFGSIATFLFTEFWKYMTIIGVTPPQH